MPKPNESAEAQLGPAGSRLRSKAHYRRAFPRNMIVFNANVRTESFGKIWYGDVDVSRSVAALRKLSEELGEPVYVLYEGDACTENQESRLAENAAAVVSAGGLCLGVATAPYFKLDLGGSPYFTEVKKTSPTSKPTTKLAQLRSRPPELPLSMLISCPLPLYRYRKDRDPLSHFYQTISEHLNFALQDISVERVFLHQRDLERLRTRQIDWLRRTQGIGRRRAERWVSFQFFDVGPKVWTKGESPRGAAAGKIWLINPLRLDLYV